MHQQQQQQQQHGIKRRTRTQAGRQALGRQASVSQWTGESDTDMEQCTAQASTTPLVLGC